MRTSPLFSSFFLHPSLHLPTTSPFSLRLAILDEATSALDLTNEGVMYNALQKIPGLTYLSVGHRPSLLRFHARRLRLHACEAQHDPNDDDRHYDDTGHFALFALLLGLEPPRHHVRRLAVGRVVVRERPMRVFNEFARSGLQQKPCPFE